MSTQSPLDFLNATIMDGFAQNIFDLLPSMNAPVEVIDWTKIRNWITSKNWVDINAVLQARGQALGVDLIEARNFCDSPGAVGYLKFSGAGSIDSDVQYGSTPTYAPIQGAACYQRFWDESVQWAAAQYILYATKTFDPKDTNHLQLNLCADCAKQTPGWCGDLPPGPSCPNPQKCTCPTGQRCVNNKCEKAPRASKLIAGRTTAPAASKFFPTQPALLLLLEAMYTEVALNPKMPEGALTKEAIAAWITSNGWPTINEAYAWAGLTQELAKVAALCQKKLPECQTEGTKLFVALRDQCVLAYSTAMGAVSDATLDDKKTTDTAAATSNTGTVVAVAVGAVALAGIGYYAWSQSQKKTNPARGKLRSQRYTSGVEKEVRRLAKRYAPGADQIFPAFEHGQWFVTVSPDPDDPSDPNSEASFSVVDTSSGLDLERL
jgi:hypothetical protein